MMGKNCKGIPMPIIEAANALIERYGQNIGYIGRFQGDEVYVFAFPEEVEIGFPFIYIYKGFSEKVIEITGARALDIIAKVK